MFKKLKARLKTVVAVWCCVWLGESLSVCIAHLHFSYFGHPATRTFKEVSAYMTSGGCWFFASTTINRIVIATIFLYFEESPSMFNKLTGGALR